MVSESSTQIVMSAPPVMQWGSGLLSLKDMFLALRWCRATAKDDVFGWLRANAAIDLVVVSIVCAAQCKFSDQLVALDVCLVA